MNYEKRFSSSNGGIIRSSNNGNNSNGSSFRRYYNLLQRKTDPVQEVHSLNCFGIEEKDADGNKVDNTTEAAKITNSTSVMLSTVAQDVNAIGYVSLGSLDDSVTALKIDGAEATAENIESGDYKVVRPFNIATKDDVSEAAQDFITYIMSADGQKIIEDNGYISVGDKPAYEAAAVEGKL